MPLPHLNGFPRYGEQHPTSLGRRTHRSLVTGLSFHHWSRLSLLCFLRNRDQSHWSFRSLNTPSSFHPQGLCPCHSFWEAWHQFLGWLAPPSHWGHKPNATGLSSPPNPSLLFYALQATDHDLKYLYLLTICLAFLEWKLFKYRKLFITALSELSKCSIHIS